MIDHIAQLCCCDHVQPLFRVVRVEHCLGSRARAVRRRVPPQSGWSLPTGCLGHVVGIKTRWNGPCVRRSHQSRPAKLEDFSGTAVQVSRGLSRHQFLESVCAYSGPRFALPYRRSEQ